MSINERVAFLPGAVLHDSHLFESAWSLDALELFGGHVALHVVRRVHLLSCALGSVHGLLHNTKYVLAQRHTLVLLLALNALLVPSVQSVCHAVLVHEDIAGFWRDVFARIMSHTALPGFKARLQFSSGRSRH